MIYSSRVWIIEEGRPQTFWTVKYYSGTDAVSHVPELSDVPDSPPDVIKKDWALKIQQRYCLHDYEGIVSAECIRGGIWPSSDRLPAPKPAHLHFWLISDTN